MRYTYTPEGLRALAKDTGPQWAGEARAALAHAADVLEAADEVIKEAQQVAAPDDAIIKEIERAIVDHCKGGDLWMSASLGKDRIKRLMEAQGAKP